MLKLLLKVLLQNWCTKDINSTHVCKGVVLLRCFAVVGGNRGVGILLLPGDSGGFVRTEIVLGVIFAYTFLSLLTEWTNRFASLVKLARYVRVPVHVWILVFEGGLAGGKHGCSGWDFQSFSTLMVGLMYSRTHLPSP